LLRRPPTPSTFRATLVDDGVLRLTATVAVVVVSAFSVLERAMTSVTTKQEIFMSGGQAVFDIDCTLGTTAAWMTFFRFLDYVLLFLSR